MYGINIFAPLVTTLRVVWIEIAYQERGYWAIGHHLAGGVD